MRFADPMLIFLSSLRTAEIMGPEHIAPETEAFIDEALIERLIRGFYDKVRQDVVLGPIFAQRITDWEPHLQRMFAFWSSVALASGRYHGQPMQKHINLPIDGRHFDRWLSLFDSTAREVCSPAAAALFMVHARRIAMSLEMGRANVRGVLLGRGERFTDTSLEVVETAS